MTVKLENVTIRYGDFVAVDDLSVTFERGSVGLLGRNGAGKSSVLKSLLGLVRPASGTMRFSELPTGASPAEVRAHVGYMPERDAHYTMQEFHRQSADRADCGTRQQQDPVVRRGGRLECYAKTAPVATVLQQMER